MLSALHFVHQCVKKEVQVFLLKENMYVYIYVCVTYMNTQTLPVPHCWRG